jgi:hypothetical protein
MSIASSADFTNKQKHHINACIIFLQVISSSDITTFDGRIITQLAYDGKREELASSLRWPNQQRPPKAWWNTWREFLLWYYSWTATSSSFNPSAIRPFTNSASDPGNGTPLQTQTHYLNGQAHNGFATTNKEGLEEGI